MSKMRYFRNNKLWRDKAVDICEEAGSVIHWQKLDDAEFDKQLRMKLAEEAEEVARAVSRDELVSELADVFAVIENLCSLQGITLQDIKEEQAKKYAERGGFAGRKYVAIVEHPVGSWQADYCVADPEKYPEIVDYKEF